MSGAITLAALLASLARCGQAHPDVQQMLDAGLTPRLVATALGESGLHLYAIGDNGTREHPIRASYDPPTLAEAQARVAELLRQGHRVDVGPMQVTDANWPAYGLSLANVFDLDANACAGARVFAAGWLIEHRASCRYNSGRPDCTAYAARIEHIEAQLPASGATSSVPAPPAPPPPPACAPAWDAWGLAECASRPRAVASHPVGGSEAAPPVSPGLALETATR